MERLVAIEEPQELAQLAVSRELPAFHPDDLVRDGADAHRILAVGDEIVGRCSLWWRHTGSIAGAKVGVIGHYAARDTSAARRLLHHACDALAREGCETVVGPMDGTTWRRYRFVTERGSEPPFFLEPDNPDEWPGHFRDAGFAPVAHYFSAVTDHLDRRDPDLACRAEIFTQRGIRIRPWDSDDADGELRRIYAVSRVSFRNNFLYAPIAESEFLAMHRPLLPLIDPRLIFLAETEERTVGFVFAAPDRLQARRGQPIDTVIVKSLAILPERIYAGLGGLLLARAQERAAGLGYARAIHALMHQSNASRNVSARSARPMRQYTLYARRLSP